MSKFTRPTFNVDDDDLERLQQEFFEKETMPSAKVYRKSAPSMANQPKKPSLFAERLNNAAAATSFTPPPMPALEEPSSTLTMLPALEKTTTTLEEQQEEFEPVMDPHPEPHIPVSKKMIDLTSLLGQVLGEIQEHDVKEVQAPNLPNFQQQDNKPARGQQGGFPKPVHRSEFKRRLEAQRKINKAPPPPPRPEAPPQVGTSASLLNNDSLYYDENDQRIGEMSQQELEEARQEIMNTLSPESIAFLQKGLLNQKKTIAAASIKMKDIQEDNSNKKRVSFAEQEDKNDLIQMKQQYFADVPLENEKLAWMDSRFLTPELQETLRLKQLEETDETQATASEAEKVYRKLRFDLQGRIVDKDHPRHQGLHHHGDEPDKAGYTLSELFYLARSQVPSQRAMVLNTLSRIIIQAKRNKQQPVWSLVWTIFTGKEHGSIIYLRSALDDRSLAVLVSAIDALSALMLDEDEVWETSLLDVKSFNSFLGHVTSPFLADGATQIKRKGLNDKLSELVDRVRQTSGQQPLGQEEQDAELAERDLIRGLIKMNILARIRYLLDGDLLQMDRTSVERLVRMLVRMAEAGQDVCEAIEQEEILDLVIQWGISNTTWPMLQDTCSLPPSLASVRLLTVLAQGSKQVASDCILEKAATMTLKYLVTSPTVAHPHYKQHAYILQFETLKLIRVLACYGYIIPTLQDLQDPIMTWLCTTLNTNKCSDLDASRAATAMGLLEVLLHVAADPHKSTPPHAMDWHQPTAYLPAIKALLRSSRIQHQQDVYEAALGYLATWASHLVTFPPSDQDMKDVWKAVVQEDDHFAEIHAVALGYTTSTNHLLRYIQFVAAYSQLVNYHPDLVDEEVKKQFRSAQLIQLLKQNYNKDLKGRYALWLWIKYCQEKDKCWGLGLGLAALEAGIKASSGMEAWLAQELVQLCLDTTKTLDSKIVGPFYLNQDEDKLIVSKALFELDGRPLKTFMYHTTTTQQQTAELSNLETTAFILSPIDALYHLDKSPIAQKSQEDASTIIANTMQLATKLFYTSDIHHATAVISLMKIFLIGDREGRQADLVSDREIFMEDLVSQTLSTWLDYLCRIPTSLTQLEEAWSKSSEYIRKAQVPFFQFYQAFVAQYASVSFGHAGFAHLLVYLVTQISTIDYRHLLLSDYRDILSTLKVVRRDQLPPCLDLKDLQQLSIAGLNLL